jgi:hypothetical protein
MKKHSIKCICGCGSVFVAHCTTRGAVRLVLDVRDPDKKYHGIVVNDPKVLDGLIEYLTAVRKAMEVS